MISWLRKLKKEFSHFNIGFKIAIFYYIMTVASTGLSTLIYREIYLNITQEKISEVSAQTLSSIQTNVNLLIGNVDSYSKMILSDSNLQNLLRKGNLYSDLNTQSQVSLYLYKFIQSVPSISSVYVFDNAKNSYSVGAKVLPSLHHEEIKNAEWYSEAVNKKGAYILRLNGGGVIFQNSKENYVSLIRLIRDIDTLESLGILVINVPEKAFKQIFDMSNKEIETNMFILNQHNQIISSNVKNGKMEIDNYVDFEKEAIRIAEEFIGEDRDAKMRKIDSTKYLVSYLSQDKHNWKFVSMLPFAKLSEESATMSLVGLVIILFNSIILFISGIFISRIVTVPVKNLLYSMKDVEKGVFNEVHIITQSHELKKLCNGYNVMIREIKKLIAKVIKEQKIIRKAELYTLQAQIKPHFLYNTLDSINSLALSGNTEEVSELVEALGTYYRISVSKGKELITVQEELEIVKNYLKIQKVRYPDLFTVSYKINPTCLSYTVPKLILQPLVENALYHGIRPQDKSGTITIGVDFIEGVVSLWVEDDGKGMTKEQIEAIINSQIGKTGDSFGLKGTLERIRILYGDANAFKIESQLDKGTKIILYIYELEK